MTLKEMVFSCLRKHIDHQFSARGLAQWIFSEYPTFCQQKKKNSASYIQTDEDLVAQIAAEIGARRPGWQKSHPELKTTEGRPRKYYWTEKTDDVAAEQDSLDLSDLLEPHQAHEGIVHAVNKISEHDLYPLLADYLNAEYNIVSMRIDEKKSSNKSGAGGNEWLHPDLVGMEDLTSNWVDAIRQCVSVVSERRALLWSFEVKLLINRANVRKCFFQTVSNSSWANLGYLVAATVEGDDTMRELQMLSSTHGIGVIQLNVSEPSESQILIPAKERPEIEWDMCNRLASENKDFVAFIERVKHFYQTGKVIKGEWQ